MFDTTFTDIITRTNTLDELCEELNTILENKTRGTYFEWFARLVLKYDSRYSNFVNKCWMLECLPEKIRQYLEIPENDIGIDLIVKTHDGDYYAVQVKYRRNIDCVINWENLSTFFGLTFGLSNKFKKGIFFTNTTNPNKYIKNHRNIICILNHSLKDITENTFAKIKDNVLKTTTKLKIPYQPKPYQTSIIKKSIKYYEEHDKGRLYMPCGTGKTLVCYWIADKLNDNKRICVVVPSLYLLSQMYNTWVALKECKYLLVGSDAEVKTCNDTGLLLSTDRDEIEEYLMDHIGDELVIITTYQSSEVLSNVCRKLKFELDLIIYDEAHKTVGSSDRLFSCLISDDNITTKKRLFTTATEKIYTGDDDNIISMDDTEVYGDVIYNYSFKKAIEDKQLCDYQIIAPLINDDGFWSVIKKNKFVVDKSIQEDPIESRYYMTVYLLCRSIREHKLTHILTFNNSNVNAKRTYQILQEMLEQMSIECNCYHLTGESSMKKRNRVVEDFVKDKCAIISSARIFQEGINIPIVDCVCFMDNKMAVIDIIQSVGRVLRLCDGKKKGYVLIPTLVNVEETDDNVFDVNPADFGTVKSVLRAIGTVDDRIVDEFVTKDSKMSGGRNKKFTTNTKDVVVNGRIEINLDELADKIGIILCDRWGTVNWCQMLGEVVKYIDENNKLPSEIDKHAEIRRLACWCREQRKAYRTGLLNRNRITKLERTTKWTWGKQSGKHKTFDEVYDEIIKWLNVHKKYPKQCSGDKHEEKLFRWCASIKRKQVINKLSDDHKTKLEKLDGWTWSSSIWNTRYGEVCEFIEEHKRLPSSKTDDQTENELGLWIVNQRQRYKKNLSTNIQIDKLEKLPFWFWNGKDGRTKFMMHYDEIKKWIHINQRIPSKITINTTEKKYASWIAAQKMKFECLSEQQQTCIKELLGMCSVNISPIKNTHRKNTHRKNTRRNRWFDILAKIKKYIDDHQKLPSYWSGHSITKNPGLWMRTTQHNYGRKIQCMKIPEIYDAWTKFLEEYGKYFE